MYDNKKKFLTVLIIAAVVFSLFTIYIYSTDRPEISAKAAALYEPETKTFLYLKNSNQRLPMASTTKIMTALLALEHLDHDKIVEADEKAVGIEGSSLYLEAGECISVIDLVYALILQSANDAAECLAIEIAGSSEAFASMMTEKAHEMGLRDTEFKNPHGLDADGHYTTAHDLAVIAARALENPVFRKISSTYKKEIETSLKTRIVVNHNKLLKNYDGCIGVKTGYTKKSGRSLVSAAERDGLTMIAVTINAPDDWTDHEKMLDFGFSRLIKQELAYQGEFEYKLPVISGDAETITVKNKDSFSLIRDSSDTEFDVQVKLPHFFTAPIQKGDRLGCVVFLSDGKILAEVPLYADESVNTKEKKGFFEKFMK